jgi:hypothetical protein
VGLLLHEGGEPVRLRTCYLDDEDLIVLAARAEALRKAHPGASRPEWLRPDLDQRELGGPD